MILLSSLETYQKGFAEGFAACQTLARLAALRNVAHANPDEPLNLMQAGFSLGCITVAEVIQELKTPT